MKTSLHTLLTFGWLLSTTYGMPASKQSNSAKKPCPPKPKGPNHKILTTEQLQTQQPLDGLPSNSNVTLVYSTLGIGHQNYTCNGTAYVQNEPGDGALAQLYDTTDFLKRNPDEINTLTQDCNYEVCKYPHLLNRLLGEHFFSATLTPTFDLYNAQPPLILSGMKVGDVPAPAPDNIDWLLLTENSTAGVTKGLSEVYRIDTFNGKAPPTCSQEGQTTSIPYAAQYWFYD